MMKKISTLLVALTVMFQVNAQTVVDIIVGSPVHNTLETAVIEANLAGALSGAGPFTVFAPTDAAFDALPAGTLDALLADPSGQLTDILYYHVVAANAPSSSLSDGQTITTLLGQDVTVTINGGVMINNAMVTVADITASNGVVHVIDAVLLPPAIVTSSIWDIVVDSPVHQTLEAAVNAAELAGVLDGAGTFTLFAPTDAAFAALPAGTVDALLVDPTGTLADILLYHVVGSVAMSGDLSNGQVITTALGQDITVTIDNGQVFINDALVTVADIEATNGVVHVIDAVLLPELPTNNIWDIVSNSDVHNTLQAAIEAAGLVETLQSAGPYTLFAPTDAAFAALPAGLIDALLADPTGDLTQILFYHVLNGVALSSDLSDGQIVTTLQGQTVTVTFSNGNVFINDAQVIAADLLADNGVVHVIDAVLVPSLEETTTVFDIISGSEVHNTLQAALEASGLDADLSTAGPFTVFAPTDAAFAALPAGLVDELLADPAGELTNILLYHVLSGAVTSDLLSEGTYTTLNGSDVTITFDGPNVLVNGNQVIIADLIADNGVVHVIDVVLLPGSGNPATVVDIIVNSDVHNTLEAAVIAADLAGTLSTDGPFTVFAPTDAAFAALPAGLLDALLADPTGELTNILLYHVVGGTALSTDLSDGQTITTLNGQDVTITINGGNVFVNDAQVIIADLIADNGVVHVIDAVLVPAALPATVYDIIVASDVHNTLELAINTAGLDGALQEEGPFTVFAPTDAAFAAIPLATITALLADIPALTDALLYHVVAGQSLSTDLSNGQSIETLNTQNVTITISGTDVFVNDAQVIVADLLAQNGVVHVIDAVIFGPDNVTENTILSTSVYPNPASEVLNITLSNASSKTIFEIVDLSGAIAQRGTLNTLTNSVDIKGLSAGAYALRVIDGDSTSITTFIKK
jgi:uncharacterized surface protein with fasciclin (FAS1) repeats